MKKLLTFVALAGIALGLTLGAIRVAAQGPTNTFPGGANGADNQSHFIPAGAHLWYYFQYAGDNSQFSVTLLNAVKDNLDFKLYLPTQITLPNEYDADKPIGRGSKSNIPCPVGQDSCDQSNNKAWLGNVTIAGRYYVEVINNGTEGKALTLLINGPKDSVSLSPPTPTSLPTPVVAASTATRPPAQPTPNALLTLMAQVAATLKAPAPGDAPTAAPATSTPQAAAPADTATSVAAAPPPPPVVAVAAPTATATPDNFYWSSALWVYDNRLRVLPPHTDSWFKFEHPGNRNIATILVPDAKLSGLEFKVYTSQQAQNYANEDKSIGVGTQPPGVCNTGPCTANDLMWSGAFSSPDTIYIRVTNTSEKYANLRLIVSGTDIVLGH